MTSILIENGLVEFKWCNWCCLSREELITFFIIVLQLFSWWPSIKISSERTLTYFEEIVMTLALCTGNGVNSKKLTNQNYMEPIQSRLWIKSLRIPKDSWWEIWTVILCFHSFRKKVVYDTEWNKMIDDLIFMES